MTTIFGKQGNYSGRVQRYGPEHFTNHTLTFDLNDYASPDACEALHQKDAQLNMGGCVGSMGNSWLGLEPGPIAPQLAQIVREGDPATTARVTQATSEANAFMIPSAHARKPAWAGRKVSGQRFDLDAALSGELLYWGRFERSKLGQGQKIVTLYLPLGGPGYLEASQLAWSPVASIIIADMLETAGYRVEIWGADAANQMNFNLTHVRTLLKASDQPLDLNAISRATHPAVARALLMPLSTVKWGRSIVDANYGQQLAIRPAVYNDPDAIAVKHTYNLQAVRTEVERVVKLFTNEEGA